MGRLTKMFEVAMRERQAATLGVTNIVRDSPRLGGVDRSIPIGDIDDREDLEMKVIGIRANHPDATEEVTLTCDACSIEFVHMIDPADKPEGFNASSAAALCTPCGDRLVFLASNREVNPAAYVSFRDGVAESVARKLRIIPARN